MQSLLSLKLDLLGKSQFVGTVQDHEWDLVGLRDRPGFELLSCRIDTVLSLLSVFFLPNSRLVVGLTKLEWLADSGLSLLDEPSILFLTRHVRDEWAFGLCSCQVGLLSFLLLRSSCHH